jgi:arylsulfatase A-like enzyme
MRIDKLFIVFLSLVFLSTYAIKGQGLNEGKNARPNIVIFLADDWSWPHASIYSQSDRVIKTPNFDRIAHKGVLFTHAFTAAPSCAPSRAAILSGQFPHRLKDAANLWSKFPNNIPVYTKKLAQNGYKVGFERKGWKPGNFKTTGWEHNPAGVRYDNFKSFMEDHNGDSPFTYWFGSGDPHRSYKKNSGINAGMDPDLVQVPAYLPDSSIVRHDILNYYFEVQRFDREVGGILNQLEKKGKLENTLVVITSDNGWPFPRSKANLYDTGTRMPMAMMWGDKIKNQVYNEFVNTIDLAPTFLDAAGLDVPEEMNGQSLLPFLIENKEEGRKNRVFVGRERHAYVRDNNVGYPSRALRTKDFLYVRNFKPNRWPAGDPQQVHSVGPFGDIDGSPTKDLIIEKQKNATLHPEKKNISPNFFFDLAMDKRPDEELYDLKKDPNQLQNVADVAKYEQALEKHRKILSRWMEKTDDPRAGDGKAKFDEYPYYGAGNTESTGHGNVVGGPSIIDK